MDSFLLESKIRQINFESFGVDLSKPYIDAGEKYLEVLFSKFPAAKSYTFVCGLGGNALDGLFTALNLVDIPDFSVKVFVVGRVKNSSDKLFVETFTKLIEKSKGNKCLTVKQDCYDSDVESSDILVESLVGTGMLGDKLNKRYRDVVKRVSHLGKPIVALDLPCQHYKPDLVISINYPKVEGAEIIDIKYPSELELLSGPGELETLWQPMAHSHKGKNGKLLIWTDKANEFELIGAAANVYKCGFDSMSINEPDEILNKINAADSIVIGNITNNFVSQTILEKILDECTNKKIVMFGNSLEILTCFEFTSVNHNIIAVFDRQTINYLSDGNSKVKLPEGVLRRWSNDNGINSALIGSKSFLVSENAEIKYIPTPGYFDPAFATKGAGYAAAFSTKNDNWHSLRAGVYASSL